MPKVIMFVKDGKMRSAKRGEYFKHGHDMHIALGDLFRDKYQIYRRIDMDENPMEIIVDINGQINEKFSDFQPNEETIKKAIEKAVRIYTEGVVKESP